MNRIIILLVAAILPMILMAQPAEVVAKKIRATEKLQLSNKTLTAIVESITVLSTHAQSPTAKAVYDLTAAMITSVSTNATLSGNGTVGDPLGIAQQGATSGQVLKWNGSAWLPAADDNTIQTLSYSAPNLSLSLGGGSVAIPQGTVTGTGAINYLSKFSSSTAITNSQIFDNGTNVGIGFASPTYPLHYYKYTKGLRMGIFGDDNTGNQSLPNYVGIDFQGYAGYVYGSIAAADRAAAVTYGGLAFFADPDVSAPTNTLRMFISGQNGNVGIGTDVLPSQKLHVKGGSLLIDNGNFLVQNNNADFTAGFIESRAATLAANDRQYLSFGHLGAELGKMGGIWSGTTYDFFVDGYAGAFNRVATFKGTGKVGIGTTTPATLLDVAGDFKLTTRTGTATKIAGFGSDDICRDLVLGTGLSISGGTLNATGTVGGTGTAGKVAYWSGTNTLTSTANFAFDGTSLAVGTSTAGAGRFNVTGNSTSVGLQVDAGTLPSFGATAQLRGSNSTSNQSFYGIDAEGSTTGAASNYLNKIGNTGAGSTLLQINTTAAGGDPVVQYNLTGGSTNWIHGIDNSDGDKFKLQPFTSVGDGDAGLTITTAGLFGINNQSPLTTLDISNATDGISIPVGTSAQRPFVSDPIIRYNSELQGLEVKNSGNWHLLNSQNSLSLTGSNVAGPSLGTSPTLTINGGFETAYTITLTVGSAPAANGIIYTRNFPFLWSSAPRAVFSAANAITASEITKFYVGTTNGTSYTINANGTLTAGAVYKLNVLVQN